VVLGNNGRILHSIVSTQTGISSLKIGIQFLDLSTGKTVPSVVRTAVDRQDFILSAHLYVETLRKSSGVATSNFASSRITLPT
jgi:hypothetical protein